MAFIFPVIWDKEEKFLEFNKEVTCDELKKAIEQEFGKPPTKLYYKKDLYAYKELHKNKTLKKIQGEKKYAVRIRVAQDLPDPSPVKRIKLDSSMKKVLYFVNYFRESFLHW